MICGRIAELLRVRTPDAARKTGEEVSPITLHSVNGRDRGKENGHVPQVEKNDISAMECVGQDDSSLRSTSDVVCSVRDLLESNDPALSSSSSSAAAAATAAAASAEQSISPVESLLASINDLLETRLGDDAQLRHQADKNQQMMNEWMIAAAVIDRFCFIVFSLCFVIGTSVLFILAMYVGR